MRRPPSRPRDQADPWQQLREPGRVSAIFPDEVLEQKSLGNYALAPDFAALPSCLTVELTDAPSVLLLGQAGTFTASTVDCGPTCTYTWTVDDAVVAGPSSTVRAPTRSFEVGALGIHNVCVMAACATDPAYTAGDCAAWSNLTSPSADSPSVCSVAAYGAWLTANGIAFDPDAWDTDALWDVLLDEDSDPALFTGVGGAELIVSLRAYGVEALCFGEWDATRGLPNGGGGDGDGTPVEVVDPTPAPTPKPTPLPRMPHTDVEDGA